MTGHCPYLRFDESHCAGCQGWRCYAFGRKKKISDPSMCQNEEEWDECPRYVDAATKSSGIGALGMPRLTPKVTPLPPPQPIGCEYMSVSSSRGCCSNMWCDAGNMMLRSTKKCYSPSTVLECKLYVKAKREGVKPHTGA